MSIENLKEFKSHLHNISEYQKYIKSYDFSISTFFKYNATILASLLCGNLYFLKDSVEHPSVQGALIMGGCFFLPVVGLILFLNYLIGGEYHSFRNNYTLTKNYKKSLAETQGQNMKKYFDDVFSLIKKHGKNHDEDNFRNIVNILGNHKIPSLELLNSFEESLGDYIKQLESSSLYTIDYFEMFKIDLAKKAMARMENESNQETTIDDNIQFFQKT